jgi:hypothetical protein
MIVWAEPRTCHSQDLHLGRVQLAGSFYAVLAQRSSSYVSTASPLYGRAAQTACTIASTVRQVQKRTRLAVEVCLSQFSPSNVGLAERWNEDTAVDYCEWTAHV